MRAGKICGYSNSENSEGEMDRKKTWLDLVQKNEKSVLFSFSSTRERVLSVRNERESSKRAIYEPSGARQILIVLYVFFARKRKYEVP